METILWAQRKSIAEKDIFSKNGTRLDNNSPEAISSYHFLVNMKLPEIYKEKNLIVRRVVPSQLKYEYIIHSNFNEVDEDNRKVAYMMYVGANNLQEFLEGIKTEPSIYGYTCKSDDYVKIKDAVIKNKKLQNIKIGIFIGIIAALVLLTIITFMQHGK